MRHRIQHAKRRGSQAVVRKSRQALLIVATPLSALSDLSVTKRDVGQRHFLVAHGRRRKHDDGSKPINPCMTFEELKALLELRNRFRKLLVLRQPNSRTMGMGDYFA